MRILASVLVLSFMFALNGCGTKPKYIIDSASQTSFSLDSHDIDSMVEIHAKSLLSKNFVKKLESSKIIAISDVENATGENIDIDLIIEQFKKSLSNYEKFTFSKAVAGSGGKVDKMLKDSRKLRNDDEFNQYSIQEKGNLLAPDYSLSGKLSRKNTRLGKNMRVDYALSFTLTDIKSGIEVWSNIAKISKIIPQDKIKEYTQSEFDNFVSKQEPHFAMDTEEWSALWAECANDDLDSCQKLADNGLKSVNQCELYDCVKIGFVYEKLNQQSKAIDYYKRDMVLGNTVAYSYLGWIYDKSGDNINAKKYFEKACDYGTDFYIYCAKLAFLYQKNKDSKQAKEYFEIACEKSSVEVARARSCYELGAMYLQGNENLLQDVRKAFELLKTSCDLKYGFGCSALGLFYENGVLVTKSPFKAKYFYSKACRLGDQEGCDNYKMLEGK
ncbi:hypothetical protein [Helicobacter sp. T3_23-1059]